MPDVSGSPLCKETKSSGSVSRSRNVRVSRRSRNQGLVAIRTLHELIPALRAPQLSYRACPGELLQWWQLPEFVGREHVEWDHEDIPPVNRVHVLPFPDVVRGEPSPLPPLSIRLIASERLATQECVNQVLDEEPAPFGSDQQRHIQVLLPAHEPRSERVSHKLDVLLLDISEGRALHVRNLVWLDVEDARYLGNAQLPRLDPLRVVGRYTDLLPLQPLFEDGNTVRVREPLVHCLPVRLEPLSRRL